MTSLDLNEARDGGVLGCTCISWIICKQSAPRYRQTTPTPHHSNVIGWMFFFTPNQQALKAKTEQLNVTELKMTSSDCTIYAYTQSISIILKVKR